MKKKAKPRRIDLWTTRRMARAAIFAALTTALAFVPIPVMPGITLDPAIPALAAVYYGPFEAYWCYVISQLMRYAMQDPSILAINPLGIFMGSPNAMILVAWLLRKVKYPRNLLVAWLGGTGFHALTIFPYCVVYYGWAFMPTIFILQVIGSLLVGGACFVIAFGGAMYMWKSRKQQYFPWRTIPPEEHFSVASRKRTILAAICAVITAVIAYAILFTPYVSDEFAGPASSPLRRYMDAWIRHPITFGIGWLSWELFKRNAEWFKQTE